jgi:hypothetical protein
MTPSKRSLGYCFRRSARPEVSQDGGAGCSMLVGVHFLVEKYIPEQVRADQELEEGELLSALFALEEQESLKLAKFDSADLESKVEALNQAQEYQQKIAPC